MKGNRLFEFFIYAIIINVVLYEYIVPHKFIWKPTFDKYDKEPFGSYVFDDVLSSSIDDYSVTDKTFYQIIHEDSTISQHAFLITEAELSFLDIDIESLYKLIHLGNQVMICTDKFPITLKDTLCFETTYAHSFQSLGVYIQEDNKRDNIYLGTDTQNPERTFDVYPHFHPVSIISSKSKWIPKETSHVQATDDNKTTENKPIFYEEKTLADEDVIHTTDSGKWAFISMNCDSMKILVWDSENNPLVIRAFIGKGEIFIVTTPLMFTNYGLLDGSNASYAFRLLSYMKGKPLVRVEAYGKHSNKPNTPLRFLLSEPPLKWAIYFTIALLMSFIFFAAKRRQRIIPVVNAPPNRNLEFMQLISNLFFQKHNNKEILKMKHTYFCAEVKKFIGTNIDFQNNTLTEHDYVRLFEKTKSEIYLVGNIQFGSFRHGLNWDFITYLHKLVHKKLSQSEVSDSELMACIDGMNKIMEDLNDRGFKNYMRREIERLNFSLRKNNIFKKIMDHLYF